MKIDQTVRSIHLEGGDTIRISCSWWDRGKNNKEGGYRFSEIVIRQDAHEQIKPEVIITDDPHKRTLVVVRKKKQEEKNYSDYLTLWR